MKKLFAISSVYMCLLAISNAAVMSFSDDFEGLATGNLSSGSANWGAAPWDVRFDVIDDAGDKRVKHDDGNNESIVVVESSVFNLTSGLDLAMTNSFASNQENWKHGVVLNYTQTGSTYDMYTVYLSRGGVDNKEIFVNIDKWDGSSSTGDSITSLMNAGTAADNWAKLNGNGSMIVTYDASEQRVGVDISIDTGFSFNSSIVDSSFSVGQVGLYGRASGDYVVTDFSVASIPEPATLALFSVVGLLISLRRLAI